MLTYTSAGLVALFFWLLWGDFSWSMRERSAGPMAQWYLKHLGVSNLVFALLISSFPAAIALLIGPIISMKSDRHRGPRGRRIPFLLVTTPVAALGMIGIGLSPIFGPMLGGFLGRLGVTLDDRMASLVCFGVFWTAFEFATIASYAVFGGLINDVVPKELLGRFHGLFRIVSLVDGMIFNYWLMGKVETHFTILLVCIGLFYGVGFLSVCLKIREGKYPPLPSLSPPKQADGGGSGGGLAAGFVTGARTYFRECFSRSYYIGVFLFFMLAALTFMPVNTFIIPYAKSINMSMDDYGKCMSLSFLISLGLAFFLGWLCDVFHPLRMTIATLTGYALVLLWGAFFARTTGSFAVAIVLHCVLSGCYWTCVASLGQRLYPHIKYAQFSSAGGTMTAIGSMVFNPLVGSLIDWTGNVYYHTFTAGCLMALLSAGIGLLVWREFKKFGGPKNYIAPE
ncbi:MFS transporter [Geminisphaera colitermitum]|uniref:MFS transporter n=1 Tax=Geminisphaera colitermitum TaxID=1148786 RepID=UPI001E5B29B3|nr:MFS transporter [Geminisphaera colitermitum]